MIYEYVATDDIAVLLPQRSDRYNLASPMCRVSRQIRNEYFYILHTTAQRLRAVVEDFKFEHIIRFLDNLYGDSSEEVIDTQGRRLRSFQISCRVFEIHSEDLRQLPLWLDRVCFDPKEGLNVDAWYTMGDEVTVRPVETTTRGSEYCRPRYTLRKWAARRLRGVFVNLVTDGRKGKQ